MGGSREVLSDQRAERAEIVKSGTWLYDETVFHDVWVVKQNFDYYYDEGLKDQPEELNSEGELFQVIYLHENRIRGVIPASKTLDEAVKIAEEKMPGIVWDNHRRQTLFHGRRYRLEE
jgi:hypothetical protein